MRSSWGAAGGACRATYLFPAPFCQLPYPDKVHFVPALPRARSGKLIRRILRKIAEGDPEGLGDTSTLADPSTVDDLRGGPTSRIWTIHAEAQS
jgi:hypothetical protein